MTMLFVKPSQSEISPVLQCPVTRRTLFVSVYLLLSTEPQTAVPAGNTSASISVTSFDPTSHGFHFRNNFINVLVDLFGLRVATYGRCGGMAYAALDYYFLHRPIPAYRQVPDCGTSSPAIPDARSYQLTNYIYKRQIDSMVSIWPFGRALDFVRYTLTSDQEVFAWTINHELKRLRHWIQAGLPVPLGLISTHDILHIGENHQVVACGYEYDACTKTITSVSIYDPNYPDNHVYLAIDYRYATIISSTGSKWRGFFVRTDYRRSLPPLL